jgi:hypothetical protein
MLKPRFAKEPPSQRSKTDTKWKLTETTEKKGEVLTAVWRNGGFSASYGQTLGLYNHCL